MTRRTLLRKIRQALAPRLYESGYLVAKDRRLGILEGSRPYKVAPLAKPRNLGGLLVGEYEGFAEDGVVTEFYVACETLYWRAIPVEDLKRILRVVANPKTRWRPRAS